MNLAEKLTRAIARAMDHAGTMPAKDAVKIHPNDWRAVVDHGREAAALIASQAARIRELEEGVEWYGEQARLARLIHSGGDPGRHALADDGGKRARSLLSRKGGE